MSESIKAVCGLILIICGVTALVVWSNDIPDATTWRLRIGSIVVAVITLSVMLAIHGRRDAAPDFLRRIAATYFNRDGFCFAFSVEESNGIACLVVHFQNQYERQSVGQIALRPGRGFFLNRPQFETIIFELSLAPGAFGRTQFPIGIPIALRGKRQPFEVGASVVYPAGKGQRLRYFDGINLRTNIDFHRPLETAIVVAAAVAWHPMLWKPATIMVDLPMGVAEEVPSNALPHTETLWQCGDDEHLSP